MKRTAMFTMLAAALFVAAGVASVFAQTPDFSGTWKLDNGRSQITTPAGRRGGRRGGRGGGAPDALVITQTALELTIERSTGQQSRTLTYALEGESSIPAGRGGNRTITSHWDGATLVSEGSQELSFGDRGVTIEMREVRSLSADGQTLTVEVIRTTPRGANTNTLVYTKAM